MVPSPFRLPLAERSDHATITAIEEHIQPSPPLGFEFNWKKPRFQAPSNHSPPQRDEDDELSAFPPLPPLFWRAPVIPTIPEPDLAEDKLSPSIPPQDDVPDTPTGSSLVVIDIDEEGTYELESVLLEEEEYSIPEYSRHRKLTGLNCIDGRLGLEEQHAFVKKEEGQKGLMCGSTLEVAGTPGSGKTTLLIQMAVRERLDSLCRARQRSKGKQKEEADDEDWMQLARRTQQVLLIDTEGSIGMDRIICIAQRHIEQLDPDLLSNRPALFRSVLAGIHYCRCTSEVELLALFQTLLPSTKRNLAASMQSAMPGHFEEKMHYTSRLPARTTMILIDTISYHLRASLSDEARQLRNNRNMLIYELKQFAERCRRRGLNLVLANQMGFTIVNKEGATTTLADKDGEGRLIPLLRNQSESILGPNEWRIVLFRAGNHHDRDCSRFAYFMGQPVLEGSEGEPEVLSSAWLPFRIDGGGIIDLITA